MWVRSQSSRFTTVRYCISPEQVSGRQRQRLKFRRQWPISLTFSGGPIRKYLFSWSSCPARGSCFGYRCRRRTRSSAEYRWQSSRKNLITGDAVARRESNWPLALVQSECRSGSHFRLRLGSALRVKRKRLAQVSTCLTDFPEHGRIGAMVESFGNPLSDLPHLASFMPRVVKAGVPMRMPLGFIGGLVSKGIAFLFTVMPASPSAFSASLPSMPFEKTSTSIRWVSVPPEIMRKPSAARVSANTFALATTCRA